MYPQFSHYEQSTAKALNGYSLSPNTAIQNSPIQLAYQFLSLRKQNRY